MAFVRLVEGIFAAKATFEVVSRDTLNNHSLRTLGFPYETVT